MYDISLWHESNCLVFSNGYFIWYSTYFSMEKLMTSQTIINLNKIFLFFFSNKSQSSLLNYFWLRLVWVMVSLDDNFCTKPILTLLHNNVHPYIYIYICVCVCVFGNRYLNQRTLSSASWHQSVWKISFSRLPVDGLGGKIDKEMCPHESTFYEREDPR